MKSKQSLLIAGAGGMLGSAFVRKQSALRKLYSKVTFTHHHKLDLTDQTQAADFLNELMPDVIINCAAMTIVDDCEKNPDLAFKINANLPQILAVWTKKNRKKLVHYSTDAVFDGEKGNYVETDQPNPLNVYAKSKLKGEQLVLKTDQNSLVLRINIIGVRGRKPYPLAEWILKKLEAQEEFTTFTDVFFAPLCVDDLVNLTLIALKKNLRGLYHLNTRDFVSKHQFALLLAKEFGYKNPKLKPIESATALSVPRPKNTYLNSAKFSLATKTDLPPVVESVKHLHQALTNRSQPFDFCH